jgi:VIT1/CCC1 family predicted Fe2+/Mn2+ transporter
VFNVRNVSFGGAAALVTSMGLIVGLNAATAVRGVVIGSLLIVGLADNLTDALSVHIYQESENLPERQALRTTIANFSARLGVCLSFIVIVALLPAGTAVVVSVAWGFLLLAGLTYMLARTRRVRALPEIFRHVSVAVIVIASSKAIGAWVLAATGGS